MRRRTTAGMRGRLSAGAVVVSLAVTGCAAEPPVSPLPIEAATSAVPVSVPSPSAVPPTSAPPSAPPTSRAAPPASSPSAGRRPVPPARTTTKAPSPSRTTTSPSACEGAVVHIIDAANDELALARGFCLATGGMLRIEHIGPGEVTTDAPELVEQHYEAGVVEIRFVRPGTVVVTIPQNGTPYEIPVVVR